MRKPWQHDRSQRVKGILLAYSLSTGATLAFGRLLLHYCLGLVQVCGQLHGQQYSLVV